mgnify:FL=1
MAFIRTEALSKHYEIGTVKVKALDGINLELDRGSFSIIMGPSGSGKSTLLHLLGGLDRPTSGDIWLNGNCLNELDEKDRKSVV